MYSDVRHPEIIKGVKAWTNPNNQFRVLMIHYTSDPDKDPDRSGAEWYRKEKAGTPKADWLKEREIDFSTKSGKLIYGPDFCDFNRDIHYISSFEFDADVEFLLSLDFGQRNPTCALVGAWTRDNVLYIIDEYYKPAIPSVSSREMLKQFSYIAGDTTGKSVREKRNLVDTIFQIKVIDPTTRAKNRVKLKDYEEIPYSVIEEFYDNGFDFEPANNDVGAGITRIREYFKIDEYGRSNLYIFKDKCPNLCRELDNYRYKELSEGRELNEPEEPVKKDDHGPDALRYMIMTRPYSPHVAGREPTMVQRDIQKLCAPRATLEDAFDVD